MKIRQLIRTYQRAVAITNFRHNRIPDMFTVQYYYHNTVPTISIYAPCHTALNEKERVHLISRHLAITIAGKRFHLQTFDLTEMRFKGTLKPFLEVPTITEIFPETCQFKSSLYPFTDYEIKEPENNKRGIEKEKVIEIEDALLPEAKKRKFNISFDPLVKDEKVSVPLANATSDNVVIPDNVGDDVVKMETNK